MKFKSIDFQLISNFVDDISTYFDVVDTDYTLPYLTVFVKPIGLECLLDKFNFFKKIYDDYEKYFTLTALCTDCPDESNVLQFRYSGCND